MVLTGKGQIYFDGVVAELDDGDEGFLDGPQLRDFLLETEKLVERLEVFGSTNVLWRDT